MPNSAERVAVGRPRPLGPTQRALHGEPRLLLGGRVGGALVEDHHHVGAQRALHRHGLLGAHEDLGAVHRRAEVHALFGDLAHGAQREDLEAAGVGEDRFLPLGEVMQVAVGLDHLHAGTQPQVEGVAEDDLGADLGNRLRRHPLDGAIGAHRHEGGCLDAAPGKGEAAAARPAIAGQALEGHEAFVTHDRSRVRNAGGSGTWHRHS